MKYFLPILLFCSFYSFAQDEVITPLIENSLLSKKGKQKIKEKSGDDTFDSTFIKNCDTITLPFLDDFSTDKFQKYIEDYSASNVTSVKEYKILDDATNIPISVNEKYTTLQTYKRQFNISTNTYTDILLPTTTLKIGSQYTYPTTYTSTLVYPPYYIYDTLDYPNSVDTIWIQNPNIFQDSASQFFITVNEPNKVWQDDDAYRNYRYAVNPWTLGVATFDGLDNEGKAYSLGATNPNYADYLTSKPIDLSSYTAADSIYMTFLYQNGGLGDLPEAIDSLVLEFYAKDLNQWFWMWSTNGGNSSEFKLKHLPVIDSKFLKKGFKFRFKNYGNLSGAFDIFNLDYVSIREGSNINDTLLKDFAFVYPIKSLIKDYTSVPWDHYKNNPSNKMSNNVEMVIRNGSNLPENNSSNSNVNVKYNGNLEGGFVVTGASLCNNSLNYNPRTFYTSYHDFSSGYFFDPSKTGTNQTFDIEGGIQAIFPNLNSNDTSYTQQVFKNYYSYDDGSSEAAYGVTGIQSKLALRYDAYEADSIIGIMTNFVPAAYDVTTHPFVLTIWENNNGKPGSILYEDDIYSPRNTIYGNSVDGFHTYYLQNNAKIKVGTTFFIGWRQFDANSLSIGLDKNNSTSGKMYYCTNGVTWNQSQVQGAIMLRPVFSTGMDSELSIENIVKDEIIVNAFPNPTNNEITVTANFNIEQIEVYSTLGKMISTFQNHNIDLSNENPGVYLFKVTGQQHSEIIRVIKK